MKAYKYMILLFAALISNLPVRGQFNSWSKIGEMPYPVAGGRAVVIDTTIFVLGGYSDSTKTNVEFIQAFYPQSGRWEIVGQLPASRYGFTAGVLDGKLVVCGGVDPVMKKSSLLILTKDSTGFTFSADTAFIYNRLFSAGMVQGSELFLFGGVPATGVTDTSDKAYIVRYDLFNENVLYRDTLIYSNADFPIQQMSAVLDNNIYLFGGVHNGVLKRIYEFRTDSNKYSRMSVNLLEPRAGGEAIVFQENREIFIIGGYNENSDALFSVEKVVLFPGFWMVDQAEPLVEARKEFMAVRYENWIIVMGGRDADNKVIRSVEAMEYSSTTDAEEPVIINDFALLGNYPNPFNPGTKIQFSIPEKGLVKLRIYSLLGELVKDFGGKEFYQGNHEIYWDGKDNAGNAAAAGIYLSRLEYNNKQFTGKMLLVK